MRLLTRGLTGSASGLVTVGFGPILLEVVRIIRGGRSEASRAIKDLENDIKISAMLIARNGKELLKPIINKVGLSFFDKPAPKISVKPKRLTVKQPNIKVEVVNFKTRKKDVNN